MADKILLTGGAGFVGHHILEGILRETDWEVIVLDRLDISGNLERILDIRAYQENKHRVKYIWWDLKAEINDIVASNIGEVNYIWHLAASSHVDRSILDPLSFVMDNVVGTTNLLNFARKQKDLKLFINFSTDEVFGPVKEGFSKELDHHHPKNPYSASKSGQEAIGEAFENCYKLPIITTHTMNVFGERQHPEKFIPLCISKILRGEVINIHSNPEKTQAAVRSYIHARNVFRALLFLTKRGFAGYDEFNIVGDKEVDALEMAKFIGGVMSMPAYCEMVDFHSSRPGHDLRYALDGTKLQEMGFEYPKTFTESLTKTIQWYLDNQRWLKL